MIRGAVSAISGSIFSFERGGILISLLLNCQLKKFTVVNGEFEIDSERDLLMLAKWSQTNLK